MTVGAHTVLVASFHLSTFKTIDVLSSFLANTWCGPWPLTPRRNSHPKDTTPIISTTNRLIITIRILLRSQRNWPLVLLLVSSLAACSSSSLHLLSVYSWWDRPIGTRQRLARQGMEEVVQVVVQLVSHSHLTERCRSHPWDRLIDNIRKECE